MSDRVIQINAGRPIAWAFGPDDRFTIAYLDCTWLSFMLLDEAAAQREIETRGFDDADPYAAFVGFYDCRKAARRMARRIMRSDPINQDAVL